MLDGLLGRGFAAKCKSLIKAIKVRIEEVRRRRHAMQKFLKKDIADLLAKGLDTNAYGRIDELISELTLSSCYDFVEQCCDLLYKKLSAMQKESECPADCKTAVASLIFAAARFSDLHELRELRDASQEKYGNSLQYSVNQKFVEDLSSPTATREKKIQLMQEIAAEFSVKWNSRDFEQRIHRPRGPPQERPLRYGSIPANDGVEVGSGRSMENYGKDKSYALPKMKHEQGSDGSGRRTSYGEKTGRGEGINMKSSGRQDGNGNGSMPRSGDEDAPTRRESIDPGRLKINNSSSDQRQNRNGTHDAGLPTSRSDRSSNGLESSEDLYLSKKESQQTLSQGKQGMRMPSECLKVQRDNKDISANSPYVGNFQEAGKLKAKSINNMLPPPYVRPPRAVKVENESGFNGITAGGGSRDDASQLKSIHTNRSYSTDGAQHGSLHTRYDDKTIGLKKGKSHDYDSTKISQDNPTANLPIPNPISVRRRHSSSSSSSRDETLGKPEDAKTEKRSSSRRRRTDSKQGLKILVDDPPRVKDEEKVLDKLLIHFSTKPTTVDSEKLRRNLEVGHAHQMPSYASGTRQSAESRLKPSNVSPVTPLPARSVSLRSDQPALPETGKVFTRAASFQPDRPAKHVHPKLPDCDDLAARIAALRG